MIGSKILDNTVYNSINILKISYYSSLYFAVM